MRKVRLRKIEDIYALGLVHKELKHINAIIVSSGKGSYKVVYLEDFDYDFIIDDNVRLISNVEVEEFSKIFDDVKE